MSVLTGQVAAPVETPSTSEADPLEEFRETDPPWQNWLFVGCGGNYYYAQPYLQLVARNARMVMWLDFDEIEPRNQERQWPLALSNVLKTNVAKDAWTLKIDQRDQKLRRVALPLSVEELSDSSQWARLTLRRKGERTGLVVVCLPDNDPARLATTTLLDRAVAESRIDHAAIVVAGTDLNMGQCYYGLCNQTGWLHDWRTQHPDIFRQTEEEGHAGCGQNPESNIQTAVLIGQCIQEALFAKGKAVHEFFWGKRPGTHGDRIIAWRSRVRPTDQPTDLPTDQPTNNPTPNDEKEVPDANVIT